MLKTDADDTDSHPVTEDDIQVLMQGEGMFASEFASSKRINVLFLGSTDEGLSDTIMLVSFDPVSHSAAIISVPRDTYYPRQGYSAGSSYNKMNAVFHDGPEASVLALHDILQGIPINYYVVCDYAGVAKIIDSMDGVPFDVPIDMIYASEEQNLNIDLRAGYQILDGDKAVQFLRFRQGYVGQGEKITYPNGDIGRVEAQQAFVKAAIKRALGLKLPSVAKTVIENVDSDITLRALLYIAKNASGMDSESVETYILPGDNANIEGLSFWQPADETTITNMLRSIYAPAVASDAVGVDAEGSEAAQEPTE